jgi:Ser/Thr protein kinase RdoA (MazF antagonist)
MGTAAPREMDSAYQALHAFGYSRFGVQMLLVTGGFSGAKVFQVKVREDIFALKQWPSGQPAHTPLSTIHSWMEHACRNGITIIPAVQRTTTQQSVHLIDGHAWELLSWMPGQPVSDPSDEQLQQVIQQLHRLHQTWRRLHPPISAPCPAVLLQYQRLTEWRSEEWDQLRRLENPTVTQAAVLLQGQIPSAIRTLQPWLNRKVLVQPCLADIWADHLLYEQNQLTGLIDFGGARLDHPAQDLARLFSSWSLTASRPLDHCLLKYPDHSDTLLTLSSTLGQTGLIVSLCNWLRWLFLEQRSFANREQCLQRMQLIYVRLCNHHHKLLG